MFQGSFEHSIDDKGRMAIPAPFRKLLADSGLNDSANGFGVQPSWPTFIAPLAIPIDHCLHSDEIHIHDRQIGDDVASDHFPLIVDFAIKE